MVSYRKGYTVDIRLKAALVTIAIIIFVALFIYAFNTLEIFVAIFSLVFLVFLIVALVYIIYSLVYLILEEFER